MLTAIIFGFSTRYNTTSTSTTHTQYPIYSLTNIIISVRQKSLPRPVMALSTTFYVYDNEIYCLRKLEAFIVKKRTKKKKCISFSYHVILLPLVQGGQSDRWFLHPPVGIKVLFQSIPTFLDKNFLTSSVKITPRNPIQCCVVSC